MRTYLVVLIAFFVSLSPARAAKRNIIAEYSGSVSCAGGYNFTSPAGGAIVFFYYENDKRKVWVGIENVPGTGGGSSAALLGDQTSCLMNGTEVNKAKRRSVRSRASSSRRRGSAS